MSATRPLWLLLGLVALGVGMAGIVLPLVPTVPLLLLAAFAFARSSPRLHDWLVGHHRLGPPIRSWRAHGAVGRRHKRLAVAMMVASVLVALLAGLPFGIVAVQGLVLSVIALFLVTRPEGPPVG